MRVLLDLNVVLDVLLSRDPWRADAAAIWDANRDGRIDAAISAASMPTPFDIMRKQADLARAQIVVENCLRSLTIVAVGRRTLEQALRLPDPTSRTTSRSPRPRRPGLT